MVILGLTLFGITDLRLLRPLGYHLIVWGAVLWVIASPHVHRAAKGLVQWGRSHRRKFVTYLVFSGIGAAVGFVIGSAIWVGREYFPFPHDKPQVAAGVPPVTSPVVMPPPTLRVEPPPPPPPLSAEARQKIILKLERKYRESHSPEIVRKLDTGDKGAVIGMAAWINEHLRAQGRSFKVEVYKLPPKQGTTGIKMTGSSDVTIDNVTITGFDKAIDATDSTGIRITNSHFDDGKPPSK